MWPWPAESRLVTANQSSGTVSLVDLEQRTVLDEVACGARPTAVSASADGRQALAAASYAGDLVLLAIEHDRLLVERAAFTWAASPTRMAWDQRRPAWPTCRWPGESAVAVVDLNDAQGRGPHSSRPLACDSWRCRPTAAGWPWAPAAISRCG